ncbi:conjugal transfer protein [Photobacterium frigidiphilum]|uniref:Conjugal transfer protein n=1 Tax=Photobacterium frigidiphilum TaxID=264736 RepID=A0A2T3J7S0_9GAMM|nr:VirB8/TrbF family protein [Photobacterium frigidiphilum]PSU44800.1 conjugal transfer protein [Photobacterium frigidiphilum]
MTMPLRSADTLPEQLPAPLKPVEGLLKAERNRWFIMSLVLGGAVLLAIAFAWYAFGKANNNKEILYVKLQPNGQWDVINYTAQDSQLYFKTTIDSLLAKYINRRYAVTPSTIASDWGEANVFLDEKLSKDFLSPDGFNAIEKAAKISQLPRNFTTVKWRFNDHYDSVEGILNGQSSPVIRTNIYFTRTVTKDGKKRPAENLMLSIQWRLNSKTWLEAQDIEFITLNPLGLKIISQSLTKEPVLEK